MVKSILLIFQSLTAVITAQYAYVDVCLHMRGSNNLPDDMSLKGTEQWKLAADNRHTTVVTIQHKDLVNNQESKACGKFFRITSRQEVTNFVQSIEKRGATRGDSGIKMEVAYLTYGGDDENRQIFIGEDEFGDAVLGVEGEGNILRPFDDVLFG